MAYRELLIGCGASRTKCLAPKEHNEWSELTTLDFNADHKPDVIWDLEKIPLPFEADYFDEIHAYHVLEHLGGQGDWRFFFDHFFELWRILKPNGLVMGIVPHWNSMWAWGDPSHKRIINSGSLVFLDQAEYERQIGKTVMADFRFYWKGNFETVYQATREDCFDFVLRAVKNE